MEKKVVASNPIMEAFGNSKTIRNENSSRFGKLIEIHFNKSNRLVGSSIKTVLLEKSRVVFQANNEQNFHIFYQLCSQFNKKEYFNLNLSINSLRSFFFLFYLYIWMTNIEPATEFYYTNQGTKICDLNDSEAFSNTLDAFITLRWDIYIFTLEIKKNWICLLKMSRNNWRTTRSDI